MKEQLKSISVLAELDRLGIKYKQTGESKIEVLCPFHDDKSPSCSVDVEEHIFKCFVCDASGDSVTLLAQYLETPRAVMLKDLAKRYNLEESKTINPATVERWHNKISESKMFLSALHKRGITDAMIRKYRIGYDEKRITIPIKNKHGEYVNVRKYLPGAPGPRKFQNTRGHGKTRLFPIEQLDYDKIVVCGGEIKAIATAERINKDGFGAITTTSGEGSWESEFSDALRDKEVFVCFDIDEAGIKAADKVCARLKKYSKSIKVVTLPLSEDKYKHGDVNDYFGEEKKTGKDFLDLLKTATEWEIDLELEEFDETPAIELSLADSTKAEFTGRKVKLKGNVAALDTAPYIIPKDVKVICDRSQDGCSMCPVFLEPVDPKDSSVTLTLHPESPAIVEMVGAKKDKQRDALLGGLRMPQCKIVEFRPLTYYNVEDVRLSPQLEITSRAINDVLLPALCIGHGLETNEPYMLSGRMYPHPLTQQSILLISKWEQALDALSNYQPEKGELEDLLIFQPEEWTLEGLKKKLNSIYGDLSANVTRIFRRNPLHLAIDLAYHSTLFFKFDDKITKGWVETLIAGDSSQGKSETILRLMDHYQLGERVECKNATVAGLLGGLQQLGKRWFVTWGVLPKHDKRIVFMEEIKGMSTEVISKLTDMRSSGIAEIPKIEKRRTHARTRLVMVSNPRSDRTMSMYNFGIDVVKELIGSPEDIRRFDNVLLVSAQEIDAETLNNLQQYRPQVEHKYTSEKCHNLIIWAWTRSPDQVKFTDDARKAILENATKLCNEYTELVPIIDRGSMRYKIGRLAIALACRTFSHENNDTVLVRKCHVDFIVEFLDKTYENPIFGYKDFSKAIEVHNTMTKVGVIKSKLMQTPFAEDLVKQLLYTNEIELRDICDWTGWDRNEAGNLLSLLVRRHALIRDQRCYRKTSQFIEFLKELVLSPDLKKMTRPEHIEEF